MGLFDLIRQWEVRFRVLNPLPHFPLVHEIVLERQTGPGYQQLGRGRPSDQCQIVCTLSGEGAFRYGSEVYRLPSGRGFLCPLGDPASSYYYPKHCREPWVFLWIDFSNQVAVEMLEDLISRHGHVVEIPLDSGFVRYLKSFHETKRAVRFITSAESGKICCDVFSLLSTLLEGDEESSQGMRLIRRAQLMITENVSRVLSLQEIADRLQVSREHLSRVFRERTGMTPQSFALKERMEVACRLLRTSSATCRQLAVQLGYANSVSFSRAFRTFYGMNPGAYRRCQGRESVVSVSDGE